MDLADHSAATKHMLTRAELPAGAGVLGSLLLLIHAVIDLSLLFAGVCAGLYALLAWLLTRYWRAPSGQHGFGWANRITLARATLVIVLAASLPFRELLTTHVWLFAAVAMMALLLDGADGAVARATGSSSDFGARFDMELDAIFIMVLCLAIVVLDKAGAWVLLIGLMRYGFIAAARRWPWLNTPLPESRRRKTVCVWQVVTLLVALLPITGTGLATVSLQISLILLFYSFGVDVLWLRRYGHRGPARSTRPSTP